MSREAAATARNAFTDALLKLDDGETRAEIEQMLVDVMDIVEQGDIEPAVLAAHAAFVERNP